MADTTELLAAAQVEARELRATCNAIRDRAEAAEAQCRQLAAAIRNHLKLCTEDTWRAMEAALSDTAQQETDDDS